MKANVALLFLLLANLFYAQERNCVSGNCVNGKGKLQITSYSYYEGQFVNKKFNGKGTFEDDDYLYVGQFKNDLYNGKGKLSVKNHGVQAKTVPFYQVYEGEFIDGIKNGQGLLAGFISKDTNSVYKGNFKNNEFYGKGSFHVYPFCVYKSDNWIDSQNFTSGTMTRDDSKLVYNGAYVKSSFNQSTSATNNAVTTTTKVRESVPQGLFITHSVKQMDLAVGQYSVAFKTDMIAKLANGFKRYFVDINRYPKKYQLPICFKVFYQLINDKNQVVSQQIKNGTEECSFNFDLEGTYTLQVAYDFHDCFGDFDKVEHTRLEFTLNSQDFVYTN